MPEAIVFCILTLADNWTGKFREIEVTRRRLSIHRFFSLKFPYIHPSKRAKRCPVEHFVWYVFLFAPFFYTFSVPLPPRRIKIRDVTPTQAKVTWSPPGGGSQYSGFRLSTSPPSDHVVVEPPVLGPRATSGYVKNLRAGQHYTVNLVTLSGKMRSAPILMSFSTGEISEADPRFPFWGARRDVS